MTILTGKMIIFPMGLWGTLISVVSEKSTCSTVQGGKPGRRRVTVFPKFGETIWGLFSSLFWDVGIYTEKDDPEKHLSPSAEDYGELYLGPFTNWVPNSPHLNTLLLLEAKLKTHLIPIFQCQLREFIWVSENSVPLNPMVLLIIIHIKWLFHCEYTQHFQTNPYHPPFLDLKISQSGKGSAAKCPRPLPHGWLFCGAAATAPSQWELELYHRFQSGTQVDLQRYPLVMSK